MITDQFKMRGFHILADTLLGFKPMDGLCQFLYKEKQISISTAGLSKGACEREVVVFEKDVNDEFTVICGEFYTVEDAIMFIDIINNLDNISLLNKTKEFLKVYTQ